MVPTALRSGSDGFRVVVYDIRKDERSDDEDEEESSDQPAAKQVDGADKQE